MGDKDKSWKEGTLNRKQDAESWEAVALEHVFRVSTAGDKSSAREEHSAVVSATALANAVAVASATAKAEAVAAPLPHTNAEASATASTSTSHTL